MLSQNSKELEERIGYHFKDKALLKQALTHSSFSNEQKVNKQKITRGLSSLEMLYWNWLPASSFISSIRKWQKDS